MKDSKTWWAEMKADPKKLNDWLQRQYRGEMRAAARVGQVAEIFEYQVSRYDGGDLKASHFQMLWTIAQQEAQHATWIFQLLRARGLTPKEDAENAEKRYWSQIDLKYHDFAKTMAAGAHAEKMRLERIEEIALDEEAPEDIRNVFMMILRDEVFHERAFRLMAGEEAMAATLPAHMEGKKLLGLGP